MGAHGTLSLLRAGLGLLVLLASVGASSLFQPPGSSVHTSAIAPHRITVDSPNVANVSVPIAANNGTDSIDVCLGCVAFMNKNFESLMTIITRIGVDSTCDKLCGLLNSSSDQLLCNTLCDTIGFNAFWEMFVKDGINPIWACEIVNACRAGVSPAATLSLCTVNPGFGPQGTNFQFKVQFTIINDTGVGMAAFLLWYPTTGDNHNLAYTGEQVFSDYPPGSYGITWQFPTNSSFETGKYLGEFYLCSGACGQAPVQNPLITTNFFFNITESS